MNKSESLKSLAPALLKAQAAIKAALKDSTNPHFKSKYADLSSVIDAVKDALNANGLVFMQGIGSADQGVTVETMLLHSSGEWISSVLEIPATKQDAQGYGSAITYGRRYGLQSMCGVPAEDDDGNAATKSAPKTVAAEQWDKLDTPAQMRLQGIVDHARAKIDAGDVPGAVSLIEAENLDADLKVALWSRFDSKERSAMKRKPA